MDCELCLQAPVTALVFASSRIRADMFLELDVCDECIGDAVRCLEGTRHSTGLAEVERWAS